MRSMVIPLCWLHISVVLASLKSGSASHDCHHFLLPEKNYDEVVRLLGKAQLDSCLENIWVRAMKRRTTINSLPESFHAIH